MIPYIRFFFDLSKNNSQEEAIACRSCDRPDFCSTLTVRRLRRLVGGAADVFLEAERKDLVVFSPEERKRAVELYLTTSMTMAEVVEHLGCPTRRCLERRLAKDPRYAGRMRSPIIPLETGRKAIEPVSGGMRRKQAARRLVVGVGAVARWINGVSRGRHGRVAVRERERRAAGSGNRSCVYVRPFAVWCG